MRIAGWTRPSVLLLAPVLVSLIAWASPGGSLYLRGFAERADTSLAAWLNLIAWYACCAVVIGIGYRAGKRIHPSPAMREIEATERFSRALLVSLTVVSAVGIVAAYREISATVSVQAALASASGNDLSTALGNEAGLATLRYTTVASGALALARRWQGRREPVLLAVNLAMLLMSALITSRMSLIMCAVAVLVTVSRLNPQLRVRLRTILIVGAVGFAMLTVLNQVRNANFYEARGVTNPVVMNFYQIETYLGAPMQASLGVANGISEGTVRDHADVDDALRVLTPTFFQSEKGDKSAATYGIRYGGVSLAPQLNTNSVFADVFVDAGWWGLLAALVGLGLVGLAVGHFSQYRGAMLVGLGIAIYPVAEVWRTYLPNQGIYVYLIAVILFLGSAIAVWQRSLTARTLRTSATAGHSVRVDAQHRVGVRPRS